MSRVFNRQKKAAARRKCWSAPASRHASSSTKEACSKKERERSDRVMATGVLRAAKVRIVDAFRQDVHGAAAGRADEDLPTFAKLAVAEQRLRRRPSPLTWRVTVSSSIVVGAKKEPEVIFGNLMDLALLRTGLGATEICEACSTINLGSARFCKGCLHKLPACYEDERAFEPTFLSGPPQPASPVTGGHGN
jgi:hypothetical protein